VQLLQLLQCLQVCGAHCCWNYITLTNFVCNSLCFFINAYNYLFPLLLELSTCFGNYGCNSPLHLAWERVLHYVGFNKEDKGMNVETYWNTFITKLFSKIPSQELFSRNDYSIDFDLELCHGCDSSSDSAKLSLIGRWSQLSNIGVSNSILAV
jgi:hypothetical protein